jgi:excisionase family DNA binding protein
MNNEIYTIKELAVKLNTSERAVRELIRDGKLKAFKQLGKYYILHVDLLEYIKTGERINNSEKTSK